MFDRILPLETRRLLLMPHLVVGALIGAAAGAVGPLAVGWLLDLAVPSASMRMVWIVAAAAAGSAMLAAGVRAFQGQVSIHLASWMGESLARKALSGLCLSRAELVPEGDAGACGSLIAQAMESWGAQAFGVLAGAAGLGAGLVAVAVTGFDLAGTAALGLAAVIGLVMLWTGAMQRVVFREIESNRTEAQATSAGEVADLTCALGTLKTLPPGGHDLGRPAFARMNRMALAATEATARWTALRSILRTAGSLGALVLLWAPGTRTPGALGASASAILVVLGALEGLMTVWVSLESYWPVRAKLDALAALPAAAPAGGIDPGRLRELRVRNLWFRYSSKSPWVLEGVDLHLVAGQTLQIQWPSGAGKSTLLRLLAGVLTPGQGEIEVNGIPMDELDLGAYRRRLGVLTQEAAFLTGTVLDILRPAIAGDEPEREAWALLHQVEADGLVKAMPLGLHTRLIQGGSGLSGGETRRLALARALHSRAELLLLDEPLAGLGETTEWLNDRVCKPDVIAIVIGHEQS